MKYRTIMDRFGDESVGDLVIKRDLHNRWMVYGVVEHSYRSRAVVVPVGCGKSVIRDYDIQIVLSTIGADRFYVRLIDDDGNVYFKVFDKSNLCLREEDQNEGCRTRIRDPDEYFGGRT